MGQSHLYPNRASTLCKSKSYHGIIYALYLLQNAAKISVLSDIGQSCIGKRETM